MAGFISAAGDEPGYAFGESISRLPCKIIFGSYPEEVVAFCRAEGVDRVALIAASEVWLKRGKKARELVSLGGVSVDLYSADGEEELFPVGKNRRVVVVAGHCGLLKAALAYFTRSKIIYLPSDCRQSGLFLPAAGENAYPALTVFDRRMYSSPKKQYRAEAFGELVAASLDAVDYKVSVLLKKAVFDKAAYSLLLGAVDCAINVRMYEDVSEGLLYGQLRLSLARLLGVPTSAAKKCAEALYGSCGAPEGEGMLRAFYVLLPLYKLFYSRAGGTGLLPDGASAAKIFAESAFGYEYKFVPLIVRETVSAAVAAKVRRAIAPYALKTLDELWTRIGGIEANYAFLYSGKHKLSSVTPRGLKNAVRAACYTSGGGTPALMRAEGFSELV